MSVRGRRPFCGLQIVANSLVRLTLVSAAEMVGQIAKEALLLHAGGDAQDVKCEVPADDRGAREGVSAAVGEPAEAAAHRLADALRYAHPYMGLVCPAPVGLVDGPHLH